MLYTFLKSNKTLSLLAPFIYISPEHIWPATYETKALANQFEYEIGFFSRTDVGYELVRHALFLLFAEVIDIALGALYEGEDL